MRSLVFKNDDCKLENLRKILVKWCGNAHKSKNLGFYLSMASLYQANARFVSVTGLQI